MSFLKGNPLGLNVNEIMNYFTQIVTSSLYNSKVLGYNEIDRFKNRLFNKDYQTYKTKQSATYNIENIKETNLARGSQDKKIRSLKQQLKSWYDMNGFDDVYKGIASDIEDEQKKLDDIKVTFKAKHDYNIVSSEDKEESLKLEMFVYKIYKLILKYTPVDTGELISAYRIERDFYKVQTYRIINNTPYAAAVHEIFSARHKAPTRAKFMQAAALEVSNIYGNPYNIAIEITSDKVELIINPRDVEGGLLVKGHKIVTFNDTKNNANTYGELDIKASKWNEEELGLNYSSMMEQFSGVDNSELLDTSDNDDWLFED